MKIITTLLFTSAWFTALGQFSIAAGGYRQIDNMFNNGYLFYFGKPILNRYNGFVIQADYTKTMFRTYAEIGYMPASFELVETQSSSNSSSQYSYGYTREYHSNLFFDFFTFKAGLGVLTSAGMKEKWWWDFSGNLFFQYDRFRREMETDQVMYQTTYESGYSQGQYYSNVTEYPPDHSPYSLIEIEKNIFQFGAELKSRVGFKNYFIELSGSLGLMDKHRGLIIFDQIISEYSLYQTSSWNLNTGIKVGYVFNRKTKPDEITE